MQEKPLSKVTLLKLQKMKERGGRIVFITAYDYPLAHYAESAGVDMILVGDSGGMTMLGYSSTIPVTMDEMIMLSKAARRGAPNTFLVGDMPMGSYQPSDRDAVINALRFLKEAECDAVKCEGGKRIVGRVRAMVDSGVLVMGHLGLTPQNAGQFGGYRVQGKTPDGLREIIDDALALQDAGVFALLLEAMPAKPAEAVKDALHIPVYGIGAGDKLDGQLIIIHDILGLFDSFTPKFAKQYLNGGELVLTALKQYCLEVRSGLFPNEEFIYPLSEKEEGLLPSFLRGDEAEVK